MHLYHYTQPAHQRYIIRILFMVPIYAICSWISLADRHFGLYLETFRDCYESWVVYNFLSLCLAYVGGPGNVINRMAGKEIAPSWLAMTCCLPHLPVDGAYIRACKQGALQFVFLKPVIAVLTLLLTWAGVYGDQEIKADKAYPYIAFVYNMSYSVALYSLLLFYLGAHDLLKPHSPLLKFVLVKSVIFLTFWQSILCATLVSNGTLEDGEDGRALQNVLICVEMIVAACMMRWAFPHDVYRDDGGAAMGRDAYSYRGGGGGFMTNVGHAISLDDVVSDTVHQFAPTYQEYVLHGNEGGAPRKVRLKTHVMMGAEMIAANNRGRASVPPRRASDGRSSLSREGGPPNGRRSSGGGARGPGGKNEADGAGMLANAGFENSYGTRDVEDDLEDDFGAWSDDEEKQQQPGTPVRGASAGAGRDHRARGNGGAAARASAFAPGGAMAPLGAESRVGAGNVFDMVAELAAPDDSPAKPPPPPPPPPTTTTTTTATERGGGGLGAAAGGGGLFQGAGGADQARRYAATSIAPLAPPPSFRVAPPPGGPRAEGPTSPEFSSFVRAPSREHGEP